MGNQDETGNPGRGGHDEPGSIVRSGHDSWENLYRNQPVEEMPWYYPGLDPDIAMAISTMDIHTGSVLDVCTGPGTQALALAERGFSVTAADISDTAVRRACEKARARGLDITFQQNDVLNSTVAQTFDYVFDRGCYHLFSLDSRKVYPAAAARLLNPRGYLFLKCFSNLEKSLEGPNRIHSDEIRDVFGVLFDVISIKNTVFQSHLPGRRYEPKALFCVLRKK